MPAPDPSSAADAPAAGPSAAPRESAGGLTGTPEVTARHGTALFAASVALLAALGLMGLVFTSSPPPQLDGHLDVLLDGFVRYRWGFVGAALIAPTFVAMLTLLLHVGGVPASSVRRSLGTTLLGGYTAIATVAYTSQFTILPRLLTRDPELAAVWYLHDVDSIPYALDLAGYALLGIAVIVLASTLIGRTRRLTLIGWLLLVMGALSLAALGLHGAGANTAASIATASSGACTLPVAVLGVVEGRAVGRNGGSVGG